MIANTKCQHCGNEFETDGMNRTEFCPHCGKETAIVAQVAVPAPVVTPETIIQPAKDGDSAIAGCLTVFAVLNFIGGVVGGFFVAMNQTDFPLVLSVFAAGLLSGLILLGFASIIEHTKASAMRLRRIEIILEKSNK